jgi:hypothetical protein
MTQSEFNYLLASLGALRSRNPCRAWKTNATELIPFYNVFSSQASSSQVSHRFYLPDLRLSSLTFHSLSGRFVGKPELRPKGGITNR